MPRKQFGMKLDEELVSRVDAVAASLSQTRTEFVELALARALGDEAYIRRDARCAGDIRRDGVARAAAFKRAKLPASVHGRAKKEG